MIKVSLCEDQTLLLKTLAGLLKNYEELSVTHLCSNGQELLDAIHKTQVVPDVVLMDLNMPVMNGFETSQQLSEKYPNVKILILSTHKGLAYVENAIKHGAHGYLNKNEEPNEIYNAIVDAYKNGFYFNDMISFKSLQEFIANGRLKSSFNEDEILSLREIEVVKLICKEKSTAEIADELNLGENTVNTYRKNILDKLGVKKSIGIVIYAIRKGIFMP